MGTRSLLFLCISVVSNNSDHQSSFSTLATDPSQDQQAEEAVPEYFSGSFFRQLYADLFYQPWEKVFPTEIDTLEKIYASFLSEILPYAFCTDEKEMLKHF